MKRCLLLFLLLSFYATLIFSQYETAWELKPFYKPAENPILRADSTFTFYCPIKKEIVQWQRADVFNPAAIVKDHKVYLLYRCEDNPAAILGERTSRIGLAVSKDGIHFKKFKEPVLYPDTGWAMQYDFPGGCEDPRVAATEDGRYVVAYTSWNQQVPRLSIAVSNDLFHWQKTGPAFAKAYDGKFKDIASKSGSIVTRMEHGAQTAYKIKGKYWMYWGEHFINLAWSDNLSDWYPLLDDSGNLKKIVLTRPYHFDSDLTECGPPAILTTKGILLLYNGKNSTNENADTSLPKGMYSVGIVIFNKDNPEQVVERSDSCFLKPTLPHEKTGQYTAGTTFAEGFVYFKKKWWLYYGTADSFVGLAVME